MTKKEWKQYTTKSVKDMCLKKGWNFKQNKNKIEIGTNEYSYGYIKYNEDTVEHDLMLNVRIELAKNYGLFFN